MSEIESHQRAWKEINKKLDEAWDRFATVQVSVVSAQSSMAAGIGPGPTTEQTSELESLRAEVERLKAESAAALARAFPRD